LADLNATLASPCQYPFRTGANRTLDFFGETFNVTDEPNFENPTGDLRSGSFLIPGSLANGLTRTLQLGMRLGFWRSRESLSRFAALRTVSWWAVLSLSPQIRRFSARSP
jgi:hypothetical protein